jgi:hypothetical protein
VQFIPVICSYLVKKPFAVRNLLTIQVMWCAVGRQQVFVVASSLGMQIFDEDGRVCKFSHPCMDMPDTVGSFARGLALIGHDMLCVG